jgi:hypothetical protein
MASALDEALASPPSDPPSVKVRMMSLPAVPLIVIDIACAPGSVRGALAVPAATCARKPRPASPGAPLKMKRDNKLWIQQRGVNYLFHAWCEDETGSHAFA